MTVIHQDDARRLFCSRSRPLIWAWRTYPLRCHTGQTPKHWSTTDRHIYWTRSVTEEAAAQHSVCWC